MNNFVLVGLCIGLIGTVLMAEKRVQQNVRIQRAKLASAVYGFEQKKKDAEELLAAGRAELEQDRSATKALQAEVQANPAATALPPLDPEHEGIWPTNRSYFYLRKSLLPTAMFPKFRRTEKALGLGPDGVAVLGMIPTEAASVDQGFQDLLDRCKQMEFDNLSLVSVQPIERTRTNWPGTKMTYRLPALRDEIEPLMEDYFDKVRATLGSQRANIYETWVKSCIAGSFWDFGSTPRILTLTDEKDERPGANRQLTNFRMTEEGGKFLYYCPLGNSPHDYGLPGEFAPRFPFRHLFGDNGQIRPGVPHGN